MTLWQIVWLNVQARWREWQTRRDLYATQMLRMFPHCRLARIRRMERS